MPILREYGDPLVGVSSSSPQAILCSPHGPAPAWPKDAEGEEKYPDPEAWERRRSAQVWLNAVRGNDDAGQAPRA